MGRGALEPLNRQQRARLTDQYLKLFQGQTLASVAEARIDTAIDRYLPESVSQKWKEKMELDLLQM
jgi:hypothetical protein